MNKYIEDKVKEWEKLIGDAPKERSILQTCDGRKNCFVCGHPYNGDKIVEELQSFLRSALTGLVEEIKKEVEKLDSGWSHDFDAGFESCKLKIDDLLSLLPEAENKEEK